jgi:hypothetical protein
MVDVSQMKTALSTLRERRRERIKLLQAAERSVRLTKPSNLQSQTADVAKYFSSTEEAFRRAMEGRRKALEQLAALAPPSLPTYVRLETPFMIWADPPDILLDSHIEAENNWAKVYSEYGQSVKHPERDYWNLDQVHFYFFWENDKLGADAVVNVTSNLMLNGICYVQADAEWIPNIFGGFQGKTELIVSAGLLVVEWWNQPPTELFGQDQIVTDLTVDNPCCVWFGRQDKTAYATISGSYDVHYDMFRIPNKGAAVFEVTVGLSHFASSGISWANFRYGNSLILCPALELEIFKAQPVAAT